MRAAELRMLLQECVRQGATEVAFHPDGSIQRVAFSDAAQHLRALREREAQSTSAPARAKLELVREADGADPAPRKEPTVEDRLADGTGFTADDLFHST
jgi:hypothetical protein